MRSTVRPFIVLLSAALLWAPAVCLAAEARPIPSAGLQVTPAEVTFERPGDGATVWVFLDGKPVPHGSMQVSIDGSYGWMFDLRPATEEPGLVRVQARGDSAEYGTYALVVKAAGQERRVLLRVGTPEDFAAAAQARSTPFSPCELDMPHEFREGQAISVESPLRMDGYWFRWMLNDEVVAEGFGESRFYYVLNDPGDIRLSLVVMDQGRALTHCSASARVVPYPPVPMTAKAGQSARFESPAGYRTAQWLLDGAPAGNASALVHTFNQSGEHRVECLASEPASSGSPPFYRVTYVVTVR